MPYLMQQQDFFHFIDFRLRAVNQCFSINSSTFIISSKNILFRIYEQLRSYSSNGPDFMQQLGCETYLKSINLWHVRWARQRVGTMHNDGTVCDVI